MRARTQPVHGVMWNVCECFFFLLCCDICFEETLCISLENLIFKVSRLCLVVRLLQQRCTHVHCTDTSHRLSRAILRSNGFNWIWRLERVFTGTKQFPAKPKKNKQIDFHSALGESVWYLSWAHLPVIIVTNTDNYVLVHTQYKSSHMPEPEQNASDRTTTIWMKWFGRINIEA